ncbi:polyphosphate kinase 1 [Taibaiella sp. KBW10]|uniref:polyphosphate kinase 1 n=1 Tax=Taibaiella sp. KBW10 TaxID=2153357 RepID=UPI000F591705|nr:polyphosphate kinase 1 [Taibaiella sp. KBW10]RQO29995.1 polyphosphate kinase 1 [Taibaiella sp. KBW10]
MSRKKPSSIIRDISWMSFNARVMQEAKDPSVSLFDRLKFLGIFSNNLDEFFRVRVASIRRMALLSKVAKANLEEDPAKTLDKIMSVVWEQNKDFDKAFAVIISELEKNNIFLKTEKQLTKDQLQFVRNYYNDHVRTQIVPLMIESIPQMPLLRDKSIYLACMLGSTQNPMMHRYSLIELPSELPRFVVLPSRKEQKDIILLEDIIRANLQQLFSAFGFDQFVGYIVKVTRDAEFDFDVDENTDLITNLEKGIKGRKKGKATRFVYDKSIDKILLEYLVKRLHLKKDNLVPGGRIHNFKDFMNFPSSVFSNLPPKQEPLLHPELIQPTRIMEVLNKKDVMLSFPYHSFDPLIDLLREAAIDPNVESIKMTCYRLAKKSQIANALVNAARNGKKVTAVLELRARFDEEANLKWKEKLEEEGVTVILGIPNMKVHAKLCLIRKKEFSKTKQYGFISTGNFNEVTSNFYGDHCLLTSNRMILADVGRVFNYLEQPQKLAFLKSCKTLPVSPLTMRSTFLDLIDKEIRNHKAKKPSGITIKLNSLVDKLLMEHLTLAAQAGVKVQIIIRGICCLLTEDKSFKTPIKAISIVDEYLEHARVFIFEHAGDPKVFISSADWMVRNLDHRVEVACPILDKEIRQDLINVMHLQLAENDKARILDNHQKNEYVPRKATEKLIRSQHEIYNYWKDKASALLEQKEK